MKHRTYILILLSLIYFVSFGQNHKLKLKKIIGNGHVNIKKNHNIIIHIDTAIYKGDITNISKDFIELRIYGRNLDKMEYDSLPAVDCKYDMHIKQGWFCKNVSTRLDNNITIFERSTDFEKIPFKRIVSLQYRKTERTDGPGIEFLAAGIGLLTSPIWLNSGGKPNWTLFYVCAGIVGLDVTFGLIRNHRYKLRTYNFSDWQIKKIK